MNTSRQSWEEIKAAARHCPFLHAAVTYADSGVATREQALAWVALELSKQNQMALERETQRLMNESAEDFRARVFSSPAADVPRSPE